MNALKNFGLASIIASSTLFSGCMALDETASKFGNEQQGIIGNNYSNRHRDNYFVEDYARIELGKDSENAFFYAESKELFGNPKIIIYNKDNGNQIFENSYQGVCSWITQEINKDLLPPGKYFIVLTGQRKIKSGSKSYLSKGVGKSEVIIKSNFTVK